jgi:hypothetical protein
MCIEQRTDMAYGGLEEEYVLPLDTHNTLAKH